MSTIDGVTLDREAIARVDASDQVTDILALPEHLRDALWKVESANLSPWDSPRGLVVAGMGGSAIGGPLARAILGDRASRPLFSDARVRRCRRGRRRTRRSCARATRATRRRRWPASRRPA